MSSLQLIRDQLAESAGVLEATRREAPVIDRVGQLLIKTFKAGNKLLTCGNGGSACDAQNFADELVGRFRRNRPALPAVSLTVNSSDLTSIGNDFGFEFIFQRQLEAHAKPGDVLVAISTSGNSPNVLRAVEAARKRRVRTVGLTGKAGGKLKGMVEHAICVPSDSVARIQEAHITIIQILCEIVESALYPDAPKAH
ncbi:MAG: D-sedoheptulose 7-phosphate isomerase [Elusimicrobia bacterium]|nr:D-sedoheptulose 7-phosphate isomerase [Elusimicrobiota bacterium]